MFSLVLLYVMTVAVVNLGLGFALALHLGVAPRRAATLSPPVVQHPIPTPAPPQVKPAAVEEPIQEEPCEEEPPPVAAAEPAPEVVEEVSEPVVAAVETFADEPPREPEPEAAPPRDKSVVEHSIQDFMQGLQQFREQVAQLDRRVRQCSRDPDTQEIEGCVQEFRHANSQYLERTSETAERLQVQKDELGPLSGVGEALQQAIAAQTLQVESTESMLDELDLSGDPQAGCQKLLLEANHLADVNRRLRAELDEARLEVAREEGWIVEIRKELLTDELTQIASRAALDAFLTERTPRDSEPHRNLSIAMIDLDHFPQLKMQFGLEVCDAILTAVAQMVAAAAPQDGLVARYDADNFVLVFPDNSARNSTRSIERVRQVLEKTQFQYGGETLSITVSCAVAQTVAGESNESLMRRLQHTLDEAKRYGRNRTFLHEGRYPAPVVPSKLTVESRTFQI